MALIHGVYLNFGIGTAIQNIQGAFQTHDHAYKAESKEIIDGGETTVAKAYWNFKEEATFTYIPASIIGRLPYNYGNSLNWNVPIIGNYVFVQDNWNYQSITGNWLVEDVQVQSSNVGAMRVILKLNRYPNMPVI